ncbi:MAG: DUF3108 domain-containing protein, partial [Burkholderiaceae bacterium]|nr:DUF3108 domain-containing protein [Burkholderiaceae bacterium]
GASAERSGASSVAAAPRGAAATLLAPERSALAPKPARTRRSVSPAAPATPPELPSPPVERSLPVAVAPASPELLAPAAAEAAAAAPAIELPVYATRLPRGGSWRYRLQRGSASGEAQLSWMPGADGRYEMRLEGRIAGVSVLDWVSHGAIDGAGIAPERFVIRRRGRDNQAANFQREAGKITFSGPTHELPLLPGAQDRLSWMIQLPAIVAAAPERFVSGATAVLFVAGARGHADVWTFVVQGAEVLGDTPALKLIREPRKLYDTRAEVWLDPAEHYLPLRALQTPSGGGPALELVREREPR